MYRIFCDGELIFHPFDSELVLNDISLSFEIGKNGTMQFVMPRVNPMWKKLKTMISIIWVMDNDEEIFRGRILEIKRDIDNSKDVTVEGLMGYLNDSAICSFDFDGRMHDFFRRIIEEHNKIVDEPKRFVVGNIDVENIEITVLGKNQDAASAEKGDFDPKHAYINGESKEWSSAMDFINDNVVANVGGYLRVRNENGVKYIDLLKDYTDEIKHVIRYAENMIDLDEAISGSDLFTVLIPIGDENLTIEKVNDGSKELRNEELISKYGRIVKTNVFSNVSKPEMLKQNGLDYMERNNNIEPTFTINALDMAYLGYEGEPIRIGDKVRIDSAPHELNNEVTCTKIEMDLQDISATEYTFGNKKPTFLERYRESRKKGKGGAGAAMEEQQKDIRSWVNHQYDKVYVDIGVNADKQQQFEDTVVATFDRAGMLIEEDATTGETIYDMYHKFQQYDNEIQIHNQYISQSSDTLNDFGGKIDALGKNDIQFHKDIRKILSKSGYVFSSETPAMPELDADGNLVNPHDVPMDSAIVEALGDLFPDETGVNLNAMYCWRADPNNPGHWSRTGVVQEIDNNYNSIIALRASTENGLAEVRASVDDVSASVVTKAEFGDKVAEIEATANAQGSEIRLKANKTYVDNLVAESIDAKFASATVTFTGTISANQANIGVITTPNNYIKIGRSGVSYQPTTLHYTDADGNAATMIVLAKAGS